MSFFSQWLFSQILGFVAKGSFGPILKVKDMSKDETYAIKVTYSTLFWILCHVIAFS